MYSNKINHDKFYTIESVVKQCIGLIDFKLYKKIIEPSAGNGAFLKYLPKDNSFGYDIEPEQSDIAKQDWFKFYDDLTDCLVVGNPPFGKRNSLSKQFIKHAISLNTQTIAFILPDVYYKHTLQSVFPKEYRLINSYKLPKNSFTINGESFNLPCTFFIWDKSEGSDWRTDPYEHTTSDFEIVTKAKSDSTCFYVMGASPNTVKEIIDVSETNRGYYIKPLNKTKSELMELFKVIDFNGYSCANGNVAWRTKSEIIKSYCENKL